MSAFGSIIDPEDDSRPSRQSLSARQKSITPRQSSRRSPRSEEALDSIRHDFLNDLDNKISVDVSEFEAEFIASNLNRKSFSPKQRQVIDRMRKKYEKII